MQWGAPWYHFLPLDAPYDAGYKQKGFQDENLLHKEHFSQMLSSFIYCW